MAFQVYFVRFLWGQGLYYYILTTFISNFHMMLLETFPRGKLDIEQLIILSNDSSLGIIPSTFVHAFNILPYSCVILFDTRCQEICVLQANFYYKILNL